MDTDTIITLSTYINTHPLAVLSTVDVHGAPHGTTLYVGSDTQLNLYFMTKRDTAKATNIETNPRVAFTLSGEDHQTTLQVHGRAIEVSSADEGTTAFQVLGALKHESRDFRLPISKLEAGPYIVYKVIVDQAVLSEYEHGNRIDGIVKVEYRA